MKEKIRKHFEICLIKIAMHILYRNVDRSPVVSRKDNNTMWYMADKLDGICANMANEYQDQT
jgi:hypothetical protein